MQIFLRYTQTQTQWESKSATKTSLWKTDPHHKFHIPCSGSLSVHQLSLITRWHYCRIFEREGRHVWSFFKIAFWNLIYWTISLQYDFLSDQLRFLGLDTDGKLLFTMKASFALVFNQILIPVLDGDAFKVLQNLIDINLRLKKEIDIYSPKHTCRPVWTIGLRTHDSFSVFRVFWNFTKQFD